MDEKTTGSRRDAPTNDPGGDNSKTVRFAAITTVGLLALIGVVAALSGLEVFHAGPHVVFALALGVVMTILVAVGLMALVFHSDRSGLDEDVSSGSDAWR